jgi:hypothetical protein
MVGALDRLSHQLEKYDQLCAYLLGLFAGSVLSVDDPSTPLECLGSAVSNPIPWVPDYH